MKLLSSLCVCHGVAMRDKQRLIYKHLLNCNELLVQTSHHAKVHRYWPAERLESLIQESWRVCTAALGHTN